MALNGSTAMHFLGNFQVLYNIGYVGHENFNCPPNCSYHEF
jgi:hypothetical protein